MSMFFMDSFLSVFAIGISFGFILFLLGAGLSLTMGLMRIVNMAHGALYMVGAYVGLATAQLSGNFWIGLLSGAICTGLIGLTMEAAQGRELYERAPPPKTLFVIPGAGHNDTYVTGGEAYWREWEKFLRGLPPP